MSNPFINYPVQGRPESPSEDYTYSARGLQRSRLACHSCRQRKTKCDGTMPCNHCSAAGKSCTYEERKKAELSTKALTSKLAGLQDKYDRLSVHSGQSEGSTSPTPSYSSTKASPPTRSRDYTQGSAPDNAHIPTEMADRLLFVTFANLERTNLEINPQQFMHNLRTQPAHLQPHPCLVNALMLLATYFTSPANPIPSTTPSPEFFVARTRHHLTESLSNVDRILDFIAASSLLVWWLFQQGRFMEAQYEISTTARLSIDCGLHKIDENVVRAVLLRSAPPAATLLPAPADALDLETRITRFWNVFVLEKAASLMLGVQSAFDDFSPLNRVTTVWPRTAGTYGNTWSLSDFGSIDDLLGSPNKHTGSPLPLLAPATVLAAEAQVMVMLTRAIRLSAIPPRSPVEAQHTRNSIVSLNGAISRFTSTLPALRSSPSPPRNHHEQQQSSSRYAFGTRSRTCELFTMSLIRSYVYIAVVHLHRAADLLAAEGSGERIASHEKRLAAAKGVVNVAAEVNREMNISGASVGYGGGDVKDGAGLMFGFLWTSAATVLAEHVSGLRQQYDRLSPTSSQRAAFASSINGTAGEIEIIAGAMRTLTVVFPVLQLQLKTVEGMLMTFRK